MMNKSLPVIFFLSMAFGLFGCRESMSESEIKSIGFSKHKRPASFISRTGLDPAQSAFSSSVRQVKGIVLLQGVAGFKDSFRTYQHPTWSKFGWMGSITADDSGNVYTAPIPFVNNLDHPLASINSIYRIDESSGEMSLFFSLPKPDSIHGIIPFGVMGLYYDPHGRKLYASSIAGSNSEFEKGKIYVIDPFAKKIVDEMISGDAMGVFVGGITGEKKLYYGACRSSAIKSVLLDKQGLIISSPHDELSLEQLGPRGNDHARRIRYDQSGNLMVYGIEFDYSLAANAEKVETLYKFSYRSGEKKWVPAETH